MLVYFKYFVCLLCFQLVLSWSFCVLLTYVTRVWRSVLLQLVHCTVHWAAVSSRSTGTAAATNTRSPADATRATAAACAGRPGTFCM